MIISQWAASWFIPGCLGKRKYFLLLSLPNGMTSAWPSLWLIHILIKHSTHGRLVFRKKLVACGSLTNAVPHMSVSPIGDLPSGKTDSISLRDCCYNIKSCYFQFFFVFLLKWNSSIAFPLKKKREIRYGQEVLSSSHRLNDEKIGTTCLWMLNILSASSSCFFLLSLFTLP